MYQELYVNILAVYQKRNLATIRLSACCSVMEFLPMPSHFLPVACWAVGTHCRNENLWPNMTFIWLAICLRYNLERLLVSHPQRLSAKTTVDSGARVSWNGVLGCCL